MENGLEGKRVFVTGAAGVIGRQVLKRLVERKAVILAADRYPLGGDQTWPQVIYLQRDISCCPLYELHDFQPEVVIHLAAAFERSRETPEFWRVNWHDNTLLSHNLVDMVKNVANAKRFIFASSYLIYSPDLYLFKSQDAAVRLLRESDFQAPRNVTGASKFYTESELEFTRAYYKPDLRVVNARIYRVYGPGSRDVVSRWVRAALRGETIEVYNKENRFDFVFAGDVAEGLLRLAESDAAQGIVNLGSGLASSIQDVVAALMRHLGTDAFEMKDLGTQEMFEASCADLTRLRAWTRWAPTTSLHAGLGELIQYERTRLGG
jgi:carbamoyl-phosphate synthase large subunit